MINTLIAEVGGTELGPFGVAHNQNIAPEMRSWTRGFSEVVVFLLGLLIVAIAGSQAAASGSIAGQVSGLKSTDTLPGVVVLFLDAVNATVRGTATSDANGAYNSGSLSAGYYKIRAAGGLIGGNVYGAAFFNANGEDLWELGGVVEVVDRSTTANVNIALTQLEPTQVLECSGGVDGTITDSAGTPLPGIRVRARNALNAMPIVVAGVPATATTNELGRYGIRTEGICDVYIKVRFDDPSGTYLAEYAGAGGADEFSLGTALTLRGSHTLNESLASVTPDQAIQNLVDLVGDLAVPNGSDLTGGLNQGIAIVLDANPNNDTAACGILDAFISRVNNQLKTGQLTETEATVLIQNATAAKKAIGCR